MDVQIHNQRPLNPTLVEESGDGKRKIVEQAKSLAPVAVGVVGAAGNVEGHARFEGVPGTFNRPSHDHHLALDQRL